MKILVFGNGNAGINVVQGIHFGCETDGICITYVYEYGYVPETVRVKRIQFDKTIKEELNIANEEKPDIILSAGWHKKLPDEMIVNYECFNIHPSLLPKYRGILPIEFQLLNKEKYSGITIHKMDDRFDAGPIYAQQSFCIENVNTVSEFVVLASRLTRRMIVKFVNNYHTLDVFSQDESKATYYSEKDRILLEGSGLG